MENQTSKIDTASGSGIVRDAIEQRLAELRKTCAIEKEALRHAQDPKAYWGDGDYWANLKEKAAVDRVKTYAAALKALDAFVDEHRALMGADWPDTEGGRQCWAPFLGGLPIGQHYCQLAEGHDGHHCNAVGKWPQGVRNDNQLNDWYQRNRGNVEDTREAEQTPKTKE